jgi:hypothetical protein
MKTIIQTMFLGAIIQQFASCQQVSEQNYEIKAEVTHEDGSPVEGAKLSALYLKPVSESPILMGKPTPTEISETDVTGHAVLKYKSLPTPSGGVAFGKKGYYGSSYPNVHWKSTGKFEDGSWQTEIKAVLKAVKNPIPMHANSMIGRVEKYIFVPEPNKDYGYDLLMAQPLPPLGTGKIADFVFRVEGSYIQIDTHDLVLKVNFRDKDEGIIEFLTPERSNLHELHMDGSFLISQYVVPESGYKRTLDRHSKQNGASDTLTRDLSPKRNFYFRTRIKRDSESQIISSHYGKIYGDFDFRRGNMENGFIASFGWAATYFNPTPNDRNVEFDPKRNLNPDGNVRQP